MVLRELIAKDLIWNGTSVYGLRLGWEEDFRLKPNRHIAVLVTNGFAARLLIRSGVARSLVAKGARVTAISPNANETYFTKECQEQGVALRQEPQGAGRTAQLFRTYRPYFLDDVLNNPALKSHHLSRCETRPFVGKTLEIINRAVARRPLVQKLSRTIECKINRSKKVQQLLTQLRPDLLVLPNPFGIEEAVYLLHARELGIPVVCQMLSWDNITSKGTPLLMPDYFISWGPIMTEELVSVYDFPRDSIYECGVPHFDVYSQRDRLTPRDDLLRELNLPRQQPSIFYGMVTAIHCPNEIDILRWLVDRVNKEAFVTPTSLVIRPHPQTVSGFYARSVAELEELRKLAGPRVAVDVPPVLSEQLSWDLPNSDMIRLASLLAGSAMCINANSTLCLDACMSNLPVINIGFDGWEKLPYEKSVRRGLDYIHMAKLLALGGIRIAKSFSDLESQINAYLRDSSLEQEGRTLSVAQECGPRDGKAVERVTNTLLELAHQRPYASFQLSSHSNSFIQQPPLV